MTSIDIHGNFAPSVRELSKILTVEVDNQDGTEVIFYFDTPEEILDFTDQIEAQVRAVLGARDLLEEEKSG